MDPLSRAVSPQVPRSYQAPAEKPEEMSLPHDAFEKNGAERGKPPEAGQAKSVSAIEGVSARTLPRPMTEEEKASFREYFPKLDVERAVVSAEATPEYNCISWTVGETHQWFWPPQMYPALTPDKAFDIFYGGYGLVPAEQGTVAHWVNDEGPTHGSISGPDHGPRWESKCGQDLQIQHDRDELDSDVYGKIAKYYAMKGAPRAMKQAQPPEIPKEVAATVKEKAAQVPAGVRDAFNSRYEDWMAFRKSPGVRMSSNPADYCKTGAFKEIVAMGVQVTPLLMDKIASGDFFSYQACREIEKAAGQGGFEISRSAGGTDEAVSEQTRAARALLAWHQDQQES
ncbi:MAG: hypothetical protein RDV48_05370 [Candidatus Eremiobacteraeota bacterium]|nr:hypothetical protein [Candidatus Eremiobacteraeota bacterium]